MTTKDGTNTSSAGPRFIEIPDWPAFREAWDKNCYQEAAIGMLYVVPDLTYHCSALRQEGIAFLAQVGNDDNEQVARKAQQILVNRYTKMVADEDIATVTKLVGYLDRIRTGIWGDPYPEMIRRYLGSFYRRFFDKPRLDPGILKAEWFQRLDEQMTQTMLVWGLGMQLVSSLKHWPSRIARCRRLEARIEAFLRARNFGEELYCVALTWRDDVPKDMSSQSACDIASGIAVRALFALREQRRVDIAAAVPVC